MFKVQHQEHPVVGFSHVLPLSVNQKAVQGPGHSPETITKVNGMMKPGKIICQTPVSGDWAIRFSTKTQRFGQIPFFARWRLVQKPESLAVRVHYRGQRRLTPVGPAKRFGTRVEERRLQLDLAREMKQPAGHGFLPMLMRPAQVKWRNILSWAVCDEEVGSNSLYIKII